MQQPLVIERRTRGVKWFVAATGLGALSLVTACTGGGSASPTPSATTTSLAPDRTLPVTSPTSTPKKADGDPIPIGVVYDSGNDVAGAPDFAAVMNSAASQINETLGGVTGRPIQLVPCASGTESAGVHCAETLIASHVELIVAGRDAHVDFGAFRSQRIPVFMTRPTATADEKLPGVSFFSGGLSSEIATMISYAIKPSYLGSKSLGVLLPPDVYTPEHIATIKAQAIAQGAQITFVIGSAGPSEPQMESYFRGLINGTGGQSSTTTSVPATGLFPPPTSPGGSVSAVPIDAILVLYNGDDTTCINAIRAHHALNFKTPALALAVCGSPSVTSRVNDDARGWSFVGGVDQTKAPYDKVVNAVADFTKLSVGTITVSDDAAAAYGILMTIVEVGNRTSDLPAGPGFGAVIGNLLASGSHQMWGGESFACGASATSPAVCLFGNLVRLYQPNEKGALANYLEGQLIVGDPVG